MTREERREAAWFAVHESLPPYWRVGPVSYDPGARAWSVTAVGRHPGRGKLPQSVSGRGEDEIEALQDLDQRLRGRAPTTDEAAKRVEQRRRFGLAFYQGAEEWSRREIGAPLDVDALCRVLRRFPDSRVDRR